MTKTALIIGGGFAGLSAAVFLDSLGIKTTLLEKKPILGGRAYSFLDKKTGDWVDCGQHLLMGAYRETLHFLENIGATHHLKYQDRLEVPLVTAGGRKTRFRLGSLTEPWNILLGVISSGAFGWKDKLRIFRLGKELKQLKNGSPKSSLDQTVDRWLASLGQSATARTNFWDPLTLAALNDDPKVAGARMLAAVLAKGFLGERSDSRLVFVRSHLNDILARPARAYLEIRGHTLHLSMGVKKIHVLNETVQGVECDSGEIKKADYYFSSVPFLDLLRFIPAGFAEELPYFRNLKQLKNSPILSLNLWFDRDVIPDEFVGIAGKKIHWYFNKNATRGKKEPPFHVMGVKSGAYDLLESSKEEILQMALSELHELFPQTRNAQLIHSLINKEREATLSPAVGSEEFRPPQQSPFENFFVIGDWTQTGLPATIESAVLSSRLAVNHLSAKQHLV